MSYVPTEAKTAIVGAKVSEGEKSKWEEAVRRLGMESVSNLIRVAVERFLDRPAPSALEKAEKVVRDVEGRYAPLIERVTAEIADAKSKLGALEEEANRLASEIEELSRPPGLEEGPESIAAKINELAQKGVLLDATNLKASQLREYIRNLEEKRRKLEARRDRQKALALRALIPEIFENVLGHLIAEICEAATALAPYLSALADRQKPPVVLRWLWTYVAWQTRKKCVDGWYLLGRPTPLFPTNYDTYQAFMNLLERYCGPIGAKAAGKEDPDEVDLAK